MTIFIVQFLYIFQLSWVEHAGLMKLVTQLCILLNASKKHVHVHSHSSAVTVVCNIFISRLLKETIWLARSTNFIYLLFWYPVGWALYWVIRMVRFKSEHISVIQLWQFKPWLHVFYIYLFKYFLVKDIWFYLVYNKKNFVIEKGNT